MLRILLFVILALPTTFEATAQTAKLKPEQIAGSRWKSTEKKGLTGNKMTFETTLTFKADGKSFSMLFVGSGGGIRGFVKRAAGTYTQEGRRIHVKIKEGSGIGAEHVFQIEGKKVYCLKWYGQETSGKWVLSKIGYP